MPDPRSPPTPANPTVITPYRQETAMTAPTDANPDHHFQDAYLATWTDPDPIRRRRLIRDTWSGDGRLVVATLPAPVHGVDAIADHIGRVHDDLIAGKGLTFAYDQAVLSGDALPLRWSVLTPAGDRAGRGVDLVFRDEDGRVTTAYMFMGVD